MGNTVSSLCGEKEKPQKQLQKAVKKEDNKGKVIKPAGDPIIIVNESPDHSRWTSPEKGQSGINRNASPNLLTPNQKRQRPNQKNLTTKDFEFLTKLGKGAFGSVVLVKKISNGKHYAMKILKKKDFYKNEKSEESVKTEKTVLMKSRHPFIVQLHYSFQDKTSLYYVLDYIEGGELFKYLRQKKVFTYDETVFYAAEVLLALSYLHDSLNTIYRDLKPENILVDKDGHIKLTDFGLSKSKFEM